MRIVRVAVAVLCLGCIGAAPADTLTPADYAADARSLDALILANYAYLDRFPGNAPPASTVLAAERDAVHDRDSLLHYAEDKIASLADHHAITGSSFKDSWGLVPSYADLWIVLDHGEYRIDAVREDSPAAEAGLRAGDRLVSVDGVPVAQAVEDYWKVLGVTPDGEARAFAARVLAAGRRDRPRHLGFATAGMLVLDNLYVRQRERPPLTVTEQGGRTVLHINNSLGDSALVAAFDKAMAAIPSGRPVLVDYSDTGSGGDAYVARAMMGWFVRAPHAFQMHNLPAEERETGIARQWIEQVLPRAGKYHPGPVRVRVGRWTGSMGEGLAIGFAALGKPVCGTRMAGLRGAVYDFNLPKTGMTVKFPAERLYTVRGQPREDFVPLPEGRCR